VEVVGRDLAAEEAAVVGMVALEAAVTAQRALAVEREVREPRICGRRVRGVVQVAEPVQGWAED
jgi:hypothetical protein